MFRALSLSAVDAHLTTVLAAGHRRYRRMRAVTLDETPRGVANMHTRADAPPIFYVVREFEDCCVVGYAQYETAIRTSYRLERLMTHARNIQESPSQKRVTVNRVQSRRRMFMLKRPVMFWSASSQQRVSSWGGRRLVAHAPIYGRW